MSHHVSAVKAAMPHHLARKGSAAMYIHTCELLFSYDGSCSFSSYDAKTGDAKNVVGMFMKRYKELNNVRSLQKHNAVLLDKLSKRDEDDLMAQAEDEVVAYFAR